MVLTFPERTLNKLINHNPIGLSDLHNMRSALCFSWCTEKTLHLSLVRSILLTSCSDPYLVYFSLQSVAIQRPLRTAAATHIQRIEIAELFFNTRLQEVNGETKLSSRTGMS